MIKKEMLINMATRFSDNVIEDLDQMSGMLDEVVDVEQNETHDLILYKNHRTGGYGFSLDTCPGYNKWYCGFRIDCKL